MEIQRTMPSKVERIEFEEGDWWEFKGYLSVAAEREWIQHAVDAQTTFTDSNPELLESLARRMDELVVKQTVGWSYGDVCSDVLRDEVPSHHYHQVAARMGDLYSPLLVKSLERAQNIYTSLSSQKASS